MTSTSDFEYRPKIQVQTLSCGDLPGTIGCMQPVVCWQNILNTHTAAPGISWPDWESFSTRPGLSWEIEQG